MRENDWQRLRKCPFCGKTPQVWEYYKGWSIECTHHECLVQPGTNIYKEKEEAIEAWNRRIENE